MRNHAFFLKCLLRGLPPLNVNEGGEVNRKKYFIFKRKTETNVPFAESNPKCMDKWDRGVRRETAR
ncbi:hypothetical protein protein [Bacillus cereus G9241]|nr:hypothetical protein protein [Bacillus cereus G9241]EAL13780.1 hypothetical protein protein [Bacillus cereus G9241]KDB39105.1 hypothetical protein DH31_25890 [Bacillus cereus]KXY28801.1 hypothetical protein AT267_29515 [Bacillus cereus]